MNRCDLLKLPGMMRSAGLSSLGVEDLGMMTEQGSGDDDFGRNRTARSPRTILSSDLTPSGVPLATKRAKLRYLRSGVVASPSSTLLFPHPCASDITGPLHQKVPYCYISD